AMRTEYKMIVDAGFLLQLDDARTAVTYDRMVPPASFAEYRNWVAKHLEVKVGAYVIEGANTRHAHEWKVWEEVKLPEGKALIPGVISHASNVVEHPELVAERIVRYAELVGRENVLA